jgi:2-polyprenyl-3-methyl-5-hydroxy-6-metoxy-1,4-benzoquinol methylase
MMAASRSVPGKEVANAAGATQSAAAQAGHYARYEEWKGWDRYFEIDAEEAEYFAGELRGIPVRGKTVLEIGFGTGSFLAWARSRGADIVGTEISQRSLAEARRFGVELLDPMVESISDQYAGRFDVIVGFDVFEHFDLDEVRLRIRAVETMLKPGGHVVLRFPNGQSPFGLPPQHGDVTHKMALSKERMVQICQGTNLKPVRYASAYGIRGQWGVTRAVRAVRRLARGMIGASLNAIYTTSIPWDPVVVLVMQKVLAGSEDAAVRRVVP